MEQTDLTEADEGKPVVNASGDEVGIVADVTDQTAHIEPEPGITETLRSKIGLEEGDEGKFALANDSVERVTDEEVHLKD